MKGNLTTPQTYGFGALLIAHATVTECSSGQIQIAQYLSNSQLIKLRRAMEISHKKRKIPAGSKNYLKHFISSENPVNQVIHIDDEKLQYTWSKFRQQAIDLLDLLLLTENLNYVLNAMRTQLRTREVLVLLKEYRRQYDRRIFGSDLTAKSLRQQVYQIMTSPIKEQSTRTSVLGLLQH